MKIPETLVDLLISTLTNNGEKAKQLFMDVLVNRAEGSSEHIQIVLEILFPRKYLKDTIPNLLIKKFLSLLLERKSEAMGRT